MDCKINKQTDYLVSSVSLVWRFNRATTKQKTLIITVQNIIQTILFYKKLFYIMSYNANANNKTNNILSTNLHRLHRHHYFYFHTSYEVVDEYELWN